jgi:hypothetical protein
MALAQPGGTVEVRMLDDAIDVYAISRAEKRRRRGDDVSLYAMPSRRALDLPATVQPRKR